VAREAPPTWPEDALEVGRIGEAWGIKGGFRVIAYADPPDALLAASRWHLRPPEVDRPGPPSPLPTTLEIASVRSRGDGLVASSPAVPDRTAAEALRGARIFIARSQFPATQADEFYWADLIGLSVVNRGGAALGTVVGLLDTGPHSVLQVAPTAADADEVLIPFVAAYVDDVDLASRRIVVDWGLDY
jgi:16S rRNA processing protein RimM